MGTRKTNYTSIYIKPEIYDKTKIQFIKDGITLKEFVWACMLLYTDEKLHNELWKNIQLQLSASLGL